MFGGPVCYALAEDSETGVRRARPDRHHDSVLSCHYCLADAPAALRPESYNDCCHWRNPDSCRAKSIPDSEHRAGGVGGSDQLQPVSVATAIYEPRLAHALRVVLGDRNGMRVVLPGGAAAAALSRWSRPHAVRCPD